MPELAEGARLEIVCPVKRDRGFESHSLRHQIQLSGICCRLPEDEVSG